MACSLSMRLAAVKNIFVMFVLIRRVTSESRVCTGTEIFWRYGMAGGKKRLIETYDAFYCSIDNWRREYHFHIKYPESRRDRSGRKYDEWDRVEIVGKVRHHSRGRTTHRRPFENVEVWLFPVHSPRCEWPKDPSDIGALMQARDGMLRVYIDLAAGAYYSIIHSLSENHFKQ